MNARTTPIDDLVLWTSDLSIGIEEVDDQHKYLVDRINGLWRALLEHREQETILFLIEDLHSYTHTHFVAEEALMRSFGYPELEAHQLSHRKFVEQIRSAGEEYMAGKPISMELLQFLNNWLQHHIKVTDRQYAAYIDRKRHGGILGRFATMFRAFNAVAKPRGESGEKGSELHGLDMQQAIAVHVQWSKRLEGVLSGGVPIPLEDASRDDRCMLGHWIAMNASGGLGKTPEFAQLREDHRAFHRCAADVLVYHAAQQDRQARALLRSQLRSLSNQVRLGIIQLYATAQ